MPTSTGRCQRRTLEPNATAPADEDDDPELGGDREHEAADDVADADLGHALLDRPDGEEEILDRQHRGDDGGAEHRAFDVVALEDLFGAFADGGGADDDPAERQHGQAEVEPAREPALRA